MFFLNRTFQIFEGPTGSKRFYLVLFKHQEHAGKASLEGKSYPRH